MKLCKDCKFFDAAETCNGPGTIVVVNPVDGSQDRLRSNCGGQRENLMVGDWLLWAFDRLPLRCGYGGRYFKKRCSVSMAERAILMGVLAESAHQARLLPTGSKAAAFNAMGVSVDDCDLKTQYELMCEVAEAFSRSVDNELKISVVTTLFGRCGMSYLPLLSKGAVAFREEP